MAQAQREGGSPLLATVIGCLGLLLLPAALLGVVVACGYMYFRSEAEPEDAVPAAPAADSAVPAGSGTVRPFSAHEAQEIQKLFLSLGSTDPAVREQAWGELDLYRQQNAWGVRDLLILELNRNRNPLFLARAAWALCRYYGQVGRSAVVAAAVRRKDELAVLQGLKEGVSSLEDAGARSAMLTLLRKALTKARSPYAGEFAQ